MILEQDNPRCTNNDYPDKREVYLEYDGKLHLDPKTGEEKIQYLKMTWDLGTNYDTWNRDNILKRAEYLASFAEEIWPIPKLNSGEKKILNEGLESVRRKESKKV